MRRKAFYLFAVLALVLLATPAFAQAGAAGPSPDNIKWTSITAGFAMAIASGLCALGQGRATASAVESVARNPGATPAIRLLLIIGLALIESLALYTLVIIFAKV
ncbi:MAG: ATP synthase F0 subunit C [Terriglobales bacterium]